MKLSDRCRPYFIRCFDVTCALVGLVVLSPVLCFIAVLILLTDGLPLIFRQKRVGRYGQAFQIWKFRTMRAHSTGAPITASGDKRITRVGRVLRKFKLDELPQFFNVLSGEMSLIGPRPEVPEFVRLDDPQWRAVLSVRPGITDLATLMCRHEEEILSTLADPTKGYREKILPAKLRLNLEYQRSRTFLRDLKLLLLTLRLSLLPIKVDPIRLNRMFGCHGANS